MEEKILTPEQVSERLQVHPFTVLKFIRQGKLRASKLGRVYRIRENDLTLFLNEQEANKSKLKKNRTEKSSALSETVIEPDKLDEEIDRSTVKGVDHYIIKS